MPVYTGNLWKDGKLISVAENVVAPNDKKAPERVLRALGARRGQHMPVVRALLEGKCIPGVFLDIREVAGDPPVYNPCVIVR